MEEQKDNQKMRQKQSKSKYYYKNRRVIIDKILALNKKIVESKEFYCKDCEKGFHKQRFLDRHMTIKKHNPEKYIRYTCPHNDCLYKTNYKGTYNRHLISKKHQKDTIGKEAIN